MKDRLDDRGCARRCDSGPTISIVRRFNRGRRYATTHSMPGVPLPIEVTSAPRMAVHEIRFPGQCRRRRQTALIGDEGGAGLALHVRSARTLVSCRLVPARPIAI
jgi:hypothetical protein